MKQSSLRVVSNRAVSEGYFCMVLGLEPGSRVPLPGQFFTARVGNSIAPLLRRPFAYAGHDNAAESNGTITLLYEARGQATQALASYLPGTEIDILGPLGNSFPQPDPGTRPVLVAGGIGLGPMLFLYNDFKAQGYDPVLVVGSRSAARTPPLPPGAVLVTDDGSGGIQGTVLQGLDALSKSLVATTVYACGPHPMMVALREWILEHPRLRSSRLWVSLEQTMACAVGACMGCVIRVEGPRPFARVCSEGPVFDASTIVWGA